MDTGAAAPGVVAVAWSGGRDSTALLHAVACAARDVAGLRVLALHVHHGLQAAADAWLAHCRDQAARWRDAGLPLGFDHRRLQLQLRPGDSLEAEARRARYAALREMALEHGAAEVWLAHHRRDQAETFLLQALRGAGAAGLAGMPREIEREGIRWVRPWLAWPREAVEAYVAHHGLSYVDDDSNADARLARNRLRLRVWPALAQAFPGAEIALSDSTHWAQEARACLADLAGLDLHGLRAGQELDAEGLLALPSHRARNALRAWFGSVTGVALPASLCERLMAELPAGGAMQWPAPAGSLRLYRGRLAWAPGCQPGRASGEPAGAASPRELMQRLDAPGDYRLEGWAGVLRVQPTGSQGVSPAALAAVRCAPRRGGETFQLAPDRPARSLKKQYQSLGIPAWERDGPLLWAGEQLLLVPGLGVDARAWALPGEAQLSLLWLPDRG